MTNQELKQALVSLFEETHGQPTPEQLATIYIQAQNSDFIEICEEVRTEFQAKKPNLLQQAKQTLDFVLQHEKTKEAQEVAKEYYSKAKQGAKDLVEKVEDKFTGVISAEDLRKLTVKESYNIVDKQLTDAARDGLHKTQFYKSNQNYDTYGYVPVELVDELEELLKSKGYQVETKDNVIYVEW